MWIAVSIPLMLLACGIATVPLVQGSIRHSRQDEDQAPKEPTVDAAAGRVEVVCPPCGARLRAADNDSLLAEARRHAWAKHGVPNSEHVLAAATPIPRPS